MPSFNRSNKRYIKKKHLGLEFLQDRRWCRKLCLFYKILENENPKYLFSLIPTRRSLYSTRNIHNIPLLDTKHKFFKNSFFPSTIIDLDPPLRKSENFSLFKSSILKLMRPYLNSVYNSTDSNLLMKDALS